jgi:arylsulfatase A-like enzyme
MLDKLGSPDPTIITRRVGRRHSRRRTACSSATHPERRHGGAARHPLTDRDQAKGEVRHQYHHCTDIVPTILECCGVTMPDVVDGVKQTPLPAPR